MNTPSVFARVRGASWALVAVPVMVLWGMAMLGCPLDSYDAGFADGFAQNNWYWDGYDDSWDAVGYEILYEGDKIPDPASPPYDAGYWDGVWTAYNDGYYVAYDTAFSDGFEEGYYAAYFEGWEEFLLTDQHIEYGTGGYDDGYNDGFSEGVVFGAYDWINYIEYDPEGALADYWGDDVTNPLDVCVPVGTGQICTGEIPLYEYGTNPALVKSGEKFEKRVEPEDESVGRRAAGGELAMKRRRAREK